jgi:hypothetical protein
MAGVRGLVAASTLALSLWLAACVGQPPQGMPAPSKAPPADGGPAPTRAAVPTAAAPPPQVPSGPGTAATAAPSAKDTVSATAPPGGPGPGAASPAPPLAPEVSAPAAPTPSPSPSGNAASQTVTAYYVLLDDGGRNGVRFGCNDSLVGVAHTSSGPKDPLPAAVRTLLDVPDEGATPTPSPEVYNALSGSDLKFLSGSFDGTTVTVYLAGTLSMGGVCDVPRVEAQLTQTAVSAVGAIRAEIYVNGRSLTETLQLG